MENEYKLVRKNVKKHFWYYVSLGIINMCGLVLLSATGFDKRTQLLIVVVLTMCSTAWSFFHHYLDHDLHTKVVIEYVLMGTFGITVAFFLIH